MLKISHIFVLLGGVGPVAGKAKGGIFVSSEVLLYPHLDSQYLESALVLLCRYKSFCWWNQSVSFVPFSHQNISKAHSFMNSI